MTSTCMSCVYTCTSCANMLVYVHMCAYVHVCVTERAYAHTTITTDKYFRERAHAHNNKATDKCFRAHSRTLSPELNLKEERTAEISQEMQAEIPLPQVQMTVMMLGRTIFLGSGIKSRTRRLGR